MEMPKIDNIVRDSKLGVTINVKAYRKLHPAELARAIAYFRSTKQGKRLKRNSTYVILSIIGIRE